MSKDSLRIMQIFEEHEKRFARAKFEKRFNLPTMPDQREKIVSGVKKVLCFDEKLVPTISNANLQKQRDLATYVEYQVTYETWKDVYGCSTVLISKSEKPPPLAFVGCGHGAKGRLPLTATLMVMKQ